MLTNDQLRQLIAEHDLTVDDVAALIGKSADTVKSWLKPPTSKSHRRMPGNDLRILMLELANRTSIQ